MFAVEEKPLNCWRGISAADRGLQIWLLSELHDFYLLSQSTSTEARVTLWICKVKIDLYAKSKSNHCAEYLKSILGPFPTHFRMRSIHLFTINPQRNSVSRPLVPNPSPRLPQRVILPLLALENTARELFQFKCCFSSKWKMLH